MPCYSIPYTNRYGRHTCTKWGDNEKDALAAAKKALTKKAGCGDPDFGAPVLVWPQPFSDESRAFHAKRADDQAKADAEQAARQAAHKTAA